MKTPTVTPSLLKKWGALASTGILAASCQTRQPSASFTLSTDSNNRQRQEITLGDYQPQKQPVPITTIDRCRKQHQAQKNTVQYTSLLKDCFGKKTDPVLNQALQWALQRDQMDAQQNQLQDMFKHRR
jgi:hypothetical protein